MSNKSSLVPWRDRSEWNFVREKLTSRTLQDVIEAYEFMSFWKLRGDKFPAYVDCTSGLLKVMVKSHLSLPSMINDMDPRLLYSVALIRFVNHVHNVGDYRNQSFYKAAKFQNIPDWLINLRHEVAHGKDLPALDTLQLAANVSMEWLMQNYWLDEDIDVNYTDASLRHHGHYIMKENMDLDLFQIYRPAIKVWEMCCEPLQNSMNLPSDLYEHYLGLVNECKRNETVIKSGEKCKRSIRKIKRFKSWESFCQIQPPELVALKGNVKTLILSLTVDDIGKYTFIQTLLQSNFMVDTTREEWKDIILLIQSMDCLTLFIESVLELTVNGNEMVFNLLMSLGASIKVLQKQWNIYKVLLKNRTHDQSSVKLKKKVKIKFAKTAKNLRICLKIQKPPIIKLEMLRYLFWHPTPNTLKLIFRYLKLVKPQLPKSIVDSLKSLLKAYCDKIQNDVKSVKPSQHVFILNDIRMSSGVKSVAISENKGSFNIGKSNNRTEYETGIYLNEVQHPLQYKSDDEVKVLIMEETRNDLGKDKNYCCTEEINNVIQMKTLESTQAANNKRSGIEESHRHNSQCDDVFQAEFLSNPLTVKSTTSASDYGSCRREAVEVTSEKSEDKENEFSIPRVESSAELMEVCHANKSNSNKRNLEEQEDANETAKKHKPEVHMDRDSPHSSIRVTTQPCQPESAIPDEEIVECDGNGVMNVTDDMGNIFQNDMTSAFSLKIPDVSPDRDTGQGKNLNIPDVYGPASKKSGMKPWRRSSFSIDELSSCPLGILPVPGAHDLQLPVNKNWTEKVSLSGHSRFPFIAVVENDGN